MPRHNPKTTPQLEQKPRVEMEFCVSCYLPHALTLIGEVLQGHAHDDGFQLVLRPGGAGSFDVRVNGSPVYSKGEGDPLPGMKDIWGSREDASPSHPARILSPKPGSCC